MLRLSHVQDQYLELTTTVAKSAHLYGLGEHTARAGLKLLKDGQPYALWNRDIGCLTDDTNLYGSHPFVMVVHEGGSLRLGNLLTI